MITDANKKQEKIKYFRTQLNVAAIMVPYT